MTTQITEASQQRLKLSPLQRKVLVFGSGSPFLDGYVIVMIGLALLQIVPLWDLSDSQTGMLAAGTLVGILIGGPVGGYITDRIGRRFMYIFDVSVIIVLSAAQFFVQDITQLVILRVLIGVVIGADYPIASTLITEFSTPKSRGWMVGALNGIWYVGGVAAALVGYALYLGSDEGWRWMLASPALIALILLIGRLGTPESPLWLASRGRRDEAIDVLHRAFPGQNIDQQIGELGETAPAGSKMGIIFSNRVYLRRLLYCGGFYALMTVPVFAIATFGPQIYDLLGLGDRWIVPYVLSNIFFGVGCFVAVLLVDRWGRRPLNIWSFVGMTIGMAILGLLSNVSPIVVFVGFIIFCLAQGGPSALAWLAPNELFPTEVRASATGLATAMSRIGAAVGTYLVPLMLTEIGVSNTMLVMAAVCLAGVVLCAALAEETKGMSLRETSAA